MLYKLLSRIDRTFFKPSIISLTDIGPVGARIVNGGIPVKAMGMRRGMPDPAGLIRLVGSLKTQRPDLVQTWMYHADLIGGLAARVSGGIPVIWNIRHVDLDSRRNKQTTIWTAKVCAKLSSSLAQKIVTNSATSRRVHAMLGYADKTMVVIPNGFDTDHFKPNPDARKSIRHELGIPQDTILIGFIARFHPQKDHRNFITAASLLAERTKDIRFLLCGDGINWGNPLLCQWIGEAGLQDYFLLLGRRNDIPLVTAALDIATSASAGEGFSNVIGEAMSCGVPSVVTDVGDSALLVGETGIVVPPHDPASLAAAWNEMIVMGTDGRLARGEKARQRVLKLFSLHAIVKQYEDLYQQTVNGAERMK